MHVQSSSIQFHAAHGRIIKVAHHQNHVLHGFLSCDEYKRATFCPIPVGESIFRLIAHCKVPCW